MEIRKVGAQDIKNALDLVLDTFMKYEAPEYSAEGIESFKSFINDKYQVENLDMYGAFDNDTIVGVIATRNNGNHISLFFVKDDRMNEGIGRKLFEKLLEVGGKYILTVNSSPYAVKIYEKLGFVSTDKEQVTDGIRYTPMIYKNN
ncbi:GNAT family N-acetyltransferase [Intestinibacter sp.]